MHAVVMIAAYTTAEAIKQKGRLSQRKYSAISHFKIKVILN